MSDDLVIEFQYLLDREPTRLMQVHMHGQYASTGISGDCFRTAIACLLGAQDPADLPHFVQDTIDANGGTVHDDGTEDIRRARLWLRDNEGLDLAPVSATLALGYGVPFVVTVQSKAGPWGHSVLVLADRTVHCPTTGSSGGYTVADINDPDHDTALVLAMPFDPEPNEWARLVRQEAGRGGEP